MSAPHIYNIGRLCSRYTKKSYSNFIKIKQQASVNSLRKCKIVIKKITLRTTFSLVPLSLYKQDAPRKPLCEKILSTIPSSVFADGHSSIYQFSTEIDENDVNVLIKCYRSVKEFILYVVRFSRIMITFIPVIILLPPTYFVGNDSYFLWKWRQLLLLTLESLGPTFIKLGQWAATRRDLFSHDFCDMFSSLHDSTSKHAYAITEKRLLEAFGSDYNTIFTDIVEEAVGSGCIAQVHKAKMSISKIADTSISYEYRRDELPLEDEKTIDVAIKVLHPDIFTRVSRDLTIMMRMASTVQWLIPSLAWLSFKESVEEFAELMMRQIDLRHEANCLDRFIVNFEDVYGIQFPKPIYPFCKQDILVETFEEGKPISSIIDLPTPQVLTSEDISDDLCDDLDDDGGCLTDHLRMTLGKLAVDALLQMIFIDNFVHGDLHPGNILIQEIPSNRRPDHREHCLIDVLDAVIAIPPETRCTRWRLVLLDVGITATLAARDLSNFKAVFRSVAIGKGESVADLMLKHAKKNNCKDEKAFKNELTDLVTKARLSQVSLSKLKIGDLLSDVFFCLSKHQVMVESNFASMLIAIFVLEGLGRSLHPELDLVERAKPFLIV